VRRWRERGTPIRSGNFIDLREGVCRLGPGFARRLGASCSSRSDQQLDVPLRASSGDCDSTRPSTVSGLLRRRPPPLQPGLPRVERLSATTAAVQCADRGDAFTVAHIFFAGALRLIGGSEKPRPSSPTRDLKGTTLPMPVTPRRRAALRTRQHWPKHGRGVGVKLARKMLDAVALIVLSTSADHYRACFPKGQPK
jgi:hypothetical protein